MPKAAELRPAQSTFTRRLRWLMNNGPRGPMQQIDLVRRAEQMGLEGPTRAEVNRLMQGVSRDPKLSTLRNIAAVLGVTLADLMPVEDSRIERRGGTVRVPMAEWNRQGFDLTGEWLTLPTEVVPVRDRHRFVAIHNPSDNFAPRTFASDLLVIDTDQKTPHEGALMAIVHPITDARILMRVFMEDDGRMRFADYAEYVYGDESLCVGEVVATFGRMMRRPSVIPTLAPETVARLRESITPAIAA